MFKMPQPVAWLVQYGGDVYTNAQLKQVRREALEEAAQVAVDAVAFNGGTVQTEAHVRAAIHKLQEGA